jgi:exoribonuclease-2
VSIGDSVAPGAVVAWFEGNRLAFGVVAGLEKQRVRLVLPGGREERVLPSRIAFEIERGGTPPGAAVEERRAAGSRAASAADRIDELGARIEVPVLWELAKEAPAPWTDASLAEVALGTASGEARAALVAALLLDGAHFVRKGDRWEPRAAKAVDEIRTQREKSAERGARRSAALDALAEAARTGAWTASGTEEERRYLDALEEVAVRDVESSEGARVLAGEALQAARTEWDRLDEGAFRLLRRVGRFASDDENLQVLRYRLKTRFTPELLAAADAAAARGFDRSGRTDLTALDVWTVDGPHTREIDDGLSIEVLPGGARRVGIHIADPTAFIEPGDPLDREAWSRATSYYFPDLRLPMLPAALSERAASLVPGEDRPTLSFLVDVDASGEIAGSRIVRAIVRSRARLDYDGVDTALAEGTAQDARRFHELVAAADLRERRRAEAGALRIAVPEIEARVGEDGSIVVEKRDPHSPGHRMVAEAMLLAGTVAAEFCSERGLPAIYRRQPAPEAQIPSGAAAIRDLVAARNARRFLRRGEVGLQPGPHFALGLGAYSQVTSPLRRFQDLVAHRQIVSALEGRSPVYDVPALQRIAATTERAEIEGRRAERAADRYWLLRFLEMRTGETIEALVVEVEPRPVVILLETMLEEPLRGRGSVALGSRIRLRIERVNPRAELLLLRPASEG